jgi:hypothetical protein
MVLGFLAINWEKLFSGANVENDISEKKNVIQNRSLSLRKGASV